MLADVTLLPRDLDRSALQHRTVIVFDVLRATTSISAALNAGISRILIYGGVDEAREATHRFTGPRLLCGEVKCLTPPGFDLGNSPGAFAPAHAGRTMFLATTNGTRAVVAAQGARRMLTASLVNAAAAARVAAKIGLDVTLLCSGTQGDIAMEDVLGAGAVLDHLRKLGNVDLASDTALMALHLFHACRDTLPAVLRQCRGGRNVIDAGLEPDIDFAARLDSISAVGEVEADPLRVVPATA